MMIGLTDLCLHTALGISDKKIINNSTSFLLLFFLVKTRALCLQLGKKGVFFKWQVFHVCFIECMCAVLVDRVYVSEIRLLQGDTGAMQETVFGLILHQFYCRFAVEMYFERTVIWAVTVCS